MKDVLITFLLHSLANTVAGYWLAIGWAFKVTFLKGTTNFFSSPQCPDWLYSPPSLLYSHSRQNTPVGLGHKIVHLSPCLQGIYPCHYRLDPS